MNLGLNTSIFSSEVYKVCFISLASLVARTVKAFAYNAGDTGLNPGSGGSPGEGNGNPLQNSCLENSMGRGAWWATVHMVAKELDGTEQLSTEQYESKNGKN